MAEPRRRTATVRFRVTALAMIVVAVVLVLTGAAILIHQRRVMTDGLDEAIGVEADALARDLDALPPDLPPVLDDDGFAQVVRGDRVVAATANIVDRPPVVGPPSRGSHVGTVDGVVDGAPAFRVLSRSVGTGADLATIHVGASLEDVDDAAAVLLRSLLVALPVVVALLGVLVWTLVGRTLAPVEGIRSGVDAISASALDRRVPDPRTDDEIGRLARTMNAMLGRLEASSRRQQQFVADASHELRSPLTRIRSEIEVDLARPDVADLQATHRSVLAEATELQRLVDDLLLLARIDAGAEPVERRPVDLDDVVLRQIRAIRDGGDPVAVAIDARQVSAAQVLGDDRQLGRAVGNLVDNAVRHATRTVTLAVHEEDGEAVLTVANDGPCIPPDQRERIFDRFTRVDGARVRDDGGAGLGLAITRDLFERHGGTVRVDPGVTEGARFVVRLPLA
jgi:signal transduction histidine kinase